MTIRFRDQDAETNHDYYADQVGVTMDIDGTLHQYLDRSRALDVRSVSLVFEVAAVAEEVTATGLTLNQLWLRMLRSADIRFRADSTQSAQEVAVVPDLTHQPTLYALQRGNAQRGQVLRFTSRTAYQVDDAVLDTFAALNTNL